MTRSALVLTMLAVAGMLAAGLAQAAAPESPVLAYVDMDKLAAGYVGMQDLNQQFQQFRAERDADLERKHKARLLDDEEQREFLDLATVAAPTEQRDKRLKELEDLSNQRERRLFTLREKKDRSAEEEAEFQQLNSIYEKRMSELAQLQRERDEAVTAKYAELSKVITDSVDAAVKAVAEEQKLGMVFRKEVVLWGGVDITDDVLAKLNAPAPAAKESE